MAAIGRTISSRELNQNIAGAKRLAKAGPVLVTDRGRPAFVLMTHEAFEALEKKELSLIDVLADTRPEADFEFDFERLTYPEPRFVDFETD